VWGFIRGTETNPTALAMIMTRAAVPRRHRNPGCP
jgi:hypothetical protein